MSKSKQALSRRELLKAMTALGGAVAASSMLPGKWAKPEVGAGVLPAHAQGTLQCPELTIISVDACRYVEPQDLCRGGEELNFLVRASWNPATNDKPVDLTLKWCGNDPQILYITYGGGSGSFSSVDIEIAQPWNLPACDTHPEYSVELWLTFESGCVLYASFTYST